MKLIKTILTTDFCPWANRYVYWMKQPLGWFAIAACAALLIGLFVSPQGWIMLACCLAVIAIQLAWPWIQIRVCSCSVNFSRNRATEWSQNTVCLTVTNRSFFPLWGLAIEQGFFVPDSVNHQDQQISVTLSRVPPFSKNVYHWDFVPQRRGVYPLQTPKISTAFPFGIWTAKKDIAVENQLTIWPQTGRLSGLPVFPSSGLAPLGTMQDKAGEQGDMLGSRLWQPGESLRMVNWAQTARTEEDLIVIERQSCSRPRVQVLIDLTPHANPARRRQVVDWQIRIQASLIAFFHGHQFELVAGYANFSKIVGASKAGLHAWMDELAILDETRFQDPQHLLTGFDSRRSENYATYVVTNATGFRRLATSSVNCSEISPILVTVDGDQLNESNLNDSIVVDLDDRTQEPFLQLANRWRTNQRVEQSV